MITLARTKLAPMKFSKDLLFILNMICLPFWKLINERFDGIADEMQTRFSTFQTVIAFKTNDVSHDAFQRKSTRACACVVHTYRSLYILYAKTSFKLRNVFFSWTHVAPYLILSEKESVKSWTYHSHWTPCIALIAWRVIHCLHFPCAIYE